MFPALEVCVVTGVPEGTTGEVVAGWDGCGVWVCGAVVVLVLWPVPATVN
jgi:hypothetical protein